MQSKNDQYQENTFESTWIRNNKGLPKDAIIWAQKFGTFLATDFKEDSILYKNKKLQKLSTSQVRRFFGQIKRLQAKGYSENSRIDLIMLEPQLAYAVGRDKKKVNREMKDTSKILAFFDEVQRAIRAIEDPNIENEQQFFKNFVNLVEAIVAYHRNAGGE